MLSSEITKNFLRAAVSHNTLTPPGDCFCWQKYVQSNKWKITREQTLVQINRKDTPSKHLHVRSQKSEICSKLTKKTPE